MSEPTRPWPKMNPVRRWGPAVVVLVLIAGLAAVATTRTPSGTTDTAGTADAEEAMPALADDPDLPITYARAQTEGTVADHDWFSCDPETGRIRFPSVYAPPCVPTMEGANGGATSKGVTADTIKVVYYSSPPGDVTSAISGQLDDDAAVAASVQAYSELLGATFQTWGRTVEIVRFTGTGISTDETAARADAVKVATQIEAFASIGGPAQTSVYQDELAARGVLCLGCGLSVPDQTFVDDAPYLWSNLPTPEQYLENVGLFLTRQLNNKPAKWAGDPKLRDRDRVFGVVHYEQDPPVFTGTEKVFRGLGREAGWEAEVNLTYLLDLAKLPETAAGLIARLKDADVTTVVFLGDPIMPIYLTQTATKQNFFPEWIVTGTVLTDTAALARNYDPEQWAHAFGVSTLPVRTPREDSDAYRIYEWYYGEEPEAAKTAATFYPNLLALYQGIQMAGPKLTPETFAGGMFRLDPTGGQPASPHISYGHTELFQFAAVDFTSVDDSTLIWWDPDAEGPDEQGTDGKGMYRYVNNGERYLPGEMPTELQPFFDETDTVTVLDGRPPELTTPDYPPPEGAPTAK